jgi:hypothetical protein
MEDKVLMRKIIRYSVIFESFFLWYVVYPKRPTVWLSGQRQVYQDYALILLPQLKKRCDSSGRAAVRWSRC